ncbi:unnamed protein product [marine sediment metagenome]|uniref:Uncharacterized protein n=1 Tax=marine sediment metagenome TaxID=412755 RepID=X1VHL5_9ZZZZ
MFQSEKLIYIAQEIADERPEFFERKGAGKGDRDTDSFMKELRERARQAFGSDFAEKQICGDTKLTVDFFFPEEAAIVEVALSLRNPNSEFEKDILKALMAKRAGKNVKTLVFLSKPGAVKQHNQPGSLAIISWANKEYGLSIFVRELVNNHVACPP